MRRIIAGIRPVAQAAIEHGKTLYRKRKPIVVRYSMTIRLEMPLRLMQIHLALMTDPVRMSGEFWLSDIDDLPSSKLNCLSF